MDSRGNINKKQATTRQILNAAADVFAEVGFAGARVDAIADRAKVNKATIYYHIGDKKALYAHVLHDVFSNLAHRISEDIHDSQTPEDKLKTFIQNFAGMVDQHPHLPAIMLREIASGGQHLPDIAVHDMTRFLAIVSDILTEGMNQDVFKTVTPFVVHIMVVGSILFFKASGSVRKKHPAMPEIIKQMDTDVSGRIADEIEALIVNALRK